MDTEEHLEIQHAKQNGHPETDEGPYYHESWWESYKGSVKGKLGGVFIGAGLGAAIGAAAAGIMAISGVVVLALPLIATFSAAGMLYAAHEFSAIGKVVGSDAATAEKLENRLKSFIKKELSGLKTGLAGKSNVKDENTKITNGEEKEYRTTHCDDHCPPGQSRKWMFWNVATIGAVVGAAAGALLTVGHVPEHLVHFMGHSAEESLGTLGSYAVTMLPLGLFGASFGVNRDIFRQVFDRTDLLFRGIVSRAPEKTPEPQITQIVEQPLERPPHAATTIVYDGSNRNSKSDTYHRERVLASAKQALLNLDHTSARPH